ncbi:diguanylate cyclase [Vibrio coralliilyticus]|uniref:sensor domain-containing diguanylate cyclase n=1 Tax=Vibrio coralliilyticus TaxID=190893 RepID=UPI001560A877|nr:diguanylate cyclase [Vibrio coralliilyticus]NRF27992.1 diguanylate cyclase [Vibrio coralliilyticus]NRF82117.1 diguanylate cyclase [Vibrio coralliilyticus]
MAAPIIGQKFISTRTVIYIITWLFSMLAVAILSGVYYALYSLDQLAEMENAQRIKLALSTEIRHSEVLLGEYSYWDETYEKIILEQDKLWAYENIENHLLENGTFDFSIVLQEGKIRFWATNSKASALEGSSLLEEDLEEMIRLSHAKNSLTKTTEGYFKFNDAIYLMIGAPLVSEQNNMPRSGTYFALGKKLDQYYLSQLAENYQLFALTLNVNVGEQIGPHTLLSPSGAAIGQLSWQTYLPSRIVFPQVAVVAIVFLVLAILVTWGILIQAYENRSVYEKQLYLEATTDGLTQLKNRRYFMALGENEQRMHRYQNKELCLLLIDIDHFKRINDTYGHSVGDEALKHIVHLCEQNLRKTDILGRLGGEEFAVLLPDTTMDDALDVANRIRESVRESPFCVEHSRLRLTVSIGIAKLQTQPHFEELLEQADKAMYQAKHAGRNTIRIYHASMHSAQPSSANH